MFLGQPSKVNTVVFSPFRVYFNLLVDHNLGDSPYYRVYIHPYGIPHHVYYSGDKREYLLDRRNVIPGKVNVIMMDHNEVNIQF